MNIADISNSILVPEFILDPFIKNGQPLKRGNGMPRQYTGGFSVVYQFEVNNELWAFRCWHTEIGVSKKRLELVSTALNVSSLPYFCDFTYVEQGLTVNGQIQPTIRMRWVNGNNLKEFLCDNAGSTRLRVLADNFLKMCKDLHEKGFAHGDLQHGNILVTSNGEVRLVDYDSMYVPQMGEEYDDNLAGLADYQHPLRKHNKIAFSGLDYFSELVIYISILAIAKDGSLIEKYNVRNTEYLLFCQKDYDDLRNSAIYKDLSGMGRNFQELLLILEDYLSHTNLSALLPFDQISEEYFQDPIIESFCIKEGELVLAGTEITLKWDTKRTLRVKLDGKEVKNSDIFHEQVNADKEYFLEVSNFKTSLKRTLKLTVVPVPQIEFTQSVQYLKRNQHEPLTLSWKVTNAEQVSLTDGTSEFTIPYVGSKTFIPEKDTTFRLKCLAKDNKSFFERELSVRLVEVCQVNFQSDKQFAFYGIPITFSWHVENADEIVLEGVGKVEAKGEWTTEFNGKETYRLKAADVFGEHVEEINVRLLPLPVIKSIMVPQPHLEMHNNIRVNMISLSAKLQNREPQGITLQNHRVEIGNLISYPKFQALSFLLEQHSWWSKVSSRLNKLIETFKINEIWKKGTRNK